MLARAASLTDIEVKDSAKMIDFIFRIDEGVKPEVEYYFDANFFQLRIPGLELSRQQLRYPEHYAADGFAPFYKYVRLKQDEGDGLIRIYLTRLCSPADPQLVGWDGGKLHVQLLKPLFKLPDEEQPPVEAEQPAASPPAETGSTGTAAGESTPAMETAGPGGAEPENDSQEPATDDSSEPGSIRGGNSSQPGTFNVPAGETAGDGGAEADRPQGRVSAPAGEPAQESGQAEETPASTGGGGEPGTTPAADFTPGPSYKQFNLDDVPVSGVEIRGLPFREALLELVASSGFNVVIGDGIDNTEVNLNFTQKDLSLKSALDLLCVAYDLAYTVGDDAIVIRAN